MPATVETEYYKSGFPKEVKRNKHDLTINKRLREARNKRGYSLAKVVALLKAQGIKTGVSTIQGYEAEEDNMNHRYPSLHMLLTLINLYDCSADFIFDRSTEIETPSKDLNILLLNGMAEWKGQKITDGQKGLAIEKIKEIMAL